MHLLTLTVSGNPVGADLVADLTTLLGDITLRPPEDFSGDATITASVTAQESGAERQYGCYECLPASVTAVAEAAVVTASRNWPALFLRMLTLSLICVSDSSGQ